MSSFEFDGEAGGGLSDEQMGTVLARIGALEAAGLLGDDDDDAWLDELAAVLAEADRIVREDQAYQVRGLDAELATAELSNAEIAMGRRVASALAARGDIGEAAAVYMELSGSGSGGTSIDLAGGHDHRGRFAGNCGPADDLGYCRSPQHQAYCPAAIAGTSASGSAEQVTAHRDSIAHRADGMIISGGIAYADAGTRQPWRVKDQVYASLGISPRESPFETGAGKPEAPTPVRVLAMGDPDDPEAVKSPLVPDPDLIERLGVAGRSADDARRIGADRITRQAFSHGSARSNLEGSGLEGSRTYAGPRDDLVPYGDGILGSLIGLSNVRNAGGGRFD